MALLHQDVWESRNSNRDTYIEEEPQVGFYERRPQLKVTKTAPARLTRASPPLDCTPSSDATSQRSSLFSRPQVSDSDDDLYNISDVESLEVPLICSNSVKKHAERVQPKWPSLNIPTSRTWPLPTGEERHSDELPSGHSIQLSPKNLAAFAAHHKARVPSRSSTPGLDGSVTSEELALSSGPSTPASRSRSPKSREWEAPARLDPEVFAILNHIAPSSLDTDGDVKLDSQSQEMKQTAQIPLAQEPEHSLERPDEVSPTATGSNLITPLTIPSPGVFFASLNRASRQTWCVNSTTPLSTGTAERFYGVPWVTPKPSPLPSATLEDFPPVPWRADAAGGDLLGRAEATPTKPPRQPSPARLQGLRLDIQHVINRDIVNQQHVKDASVLSPVEGIEATEMTDPSHSSGAFVSVSEPQFDRTKKWLYAQYAFVQALSGEPPKTPITTAPKLKSCFSPDTPDTPDNGKTSSSKGVVDQSPSKKSVRFREAISEETIEAHSPCINPEALFLDGFNHLTSAQRPTDAFLQGQARVEAQHVLSNHMPLSYRAQLSGCFALKDVDRPVQHRPISALVPCPPDEERVAAQAAAERERQVLQQISPSTWEIQAANHVFGTELISAPARTMLRSIPNALILDYGGQAECGWGWAVALQYRSASVITVPPHEAAAHGAVRSTPDTAPPLQGPPNYTTQHFDPTSNYHALPFPDSTFDVISARSLHTFLRTTYPLPITNPYTDEWDVLMAEFMRVLKPGGYLEFNLLDAELLHPAGPHSHALSTEFAFSLRRHGYDPSPTRSFLPRLRRAGFVGPDAVKRSWLILPCADVVPRWHDAGKSRGSSASLSKHARSSSAVSAWSSSAAGSCWSPAAAYAAISPSGGDDEAASLPFRDGMRFFSVARSRSGSDASTEREQLCTSPSSGSSGGGGNYEPPLVGSTRHVRAMTGLVGARGWQRWMLRLQREMGGDEARTLSRINRALEEGGRGKTGWRCLVGWARKPLLQ